MESLFKLQFWFNLRPGPLTPISGKALIVLIVVSLLVYLVIKIYKRKNKTSLYNKILNGLENFSLSNFFIGLFLLFFSYELVPFLSSRFWFLLWAIGVGVWLFFIIKSAVVIPTIKQKIEEEKEFKKYLPQKK